MDASVLAELQRFQKTRGFVGKGPLSVALHITRLAKENGLPIQVDKLPASSGTQVAGLGVGRVQRILADYDEHRTLASEGGRTSRGSLSKAQDYADFLNTLGQTDLIDLNEIEKWWMEQVRAFFAAKPLQLSHEHGRTFESIIGQLIEQARTRQKDQQGSTLAGSVLQHLVGAKIEIVLGNKNPTLPHHGASVADAQTARTGDFLIAQTSIHVTLTPGDAVIAKCIANIEAGLRPILIVPFVRTQDALNRAGDMGVRLKLEIIPAEQFIASNIHEWAQFDVSRTAASLTELIEMYNKIVILAETDRSLLIEM